MSLRVYAVVIACVLAIAAGQVLFKLGANLLRKADTYFDVVALAVLAGGLFLYVITTIAWIWALQYVPLSRAYPFMAFAFVLVPLAGYFLFGESINLTYGIGIFLVVVGVILTGISAP